MGIHTINIRTIDFNSGGSTPTPGTSDYDQLTNKPKINSVELSGNKTSEDLGIDSAVWE